MTTIDRVVGSCIYNKLLSGPNATTIDRVVGSCIYNKLLSGPSVITIDRVVGSCMYNTTLIWPQCDYNRQNGRPLYGQYRSLA